MNQIDVLPFQTMSNHLNILLRNLGAQAAPGRDRENSRGAMARERAAGGRRSSRLAPYQPLPAPRGDGQVHAEAKGVDCGNNPECSASNISRVILIWGTGSINSDVMRSGIKRHPYHMNLGDIFLSALEALFGSILLVAFPCPAIIAPELRPFQVGRNWTLARTRSQS